VFVFDLRYFPLAQRKRGAPSSQFLLDTVERGVATAGGLGIGPPVWFVYEGRMCHQFPLSSLKNMSLISHLGVYFT
jgi:hypothetical protein